MSPGLLLSAEHHIDDMDHAVRGTVVHLYHIASAKNKIVKKSLSQAVAAKPPWQALQLPCLAASKIWREKKMTMATIIINGEKTLTKKLPGLRKMGQRCHWSQDMTLMST